MMKFSDFNEALKIVKKNWKSDFDGYRVEYNDAQNHHLIPRIQERTDISLNELKKKLDLGIQYMIKKNEKGFFKKELSVAIHFTESKFKALFYINPEEKYIRLQTILHPEMKTRNTIRWELNESDDLVLLDIEE